MRRQAPIYDPLNDEHRSAEWEIELAEMKGTDKLAQAVNEYHAELFEDQKEWMQEKQDTVLWKCMMRRMLWILRSVRQSKSRQNGNPTISIATNIKDSHLLQKANHYFMPAYIPAPPSQIP